MTSRRKHRIISFKLWDIIIKENIDKLDFIEIKTSAHKVIYAFAYIIKIY